MLLEQCLKYKQKTEVEHKSGTEGELMTSPKKCIRGWEKDIWDGFRFLTCLNQKILMVGTRER